MRKPNQGDDDEEEEEEEPSHPDEGCIDEDEHTEPVVKITARPSRSQGLEQSKTIVKPIPRGSSFFVFSHTNRLADSGRIKLISFSFFLFLFSPSSTLLVYTNHCKYKNWRGRGAVDVGGEQTRAWVMIKDRMMMRIAKKTPGKKRRKKRTRSRKKRRMMAGSRGRCDQDAPRPLPAPTKPSYLYLPTVPSSFSPTPTGSLTMNEQHTKKTDAAQRITCPLLVAQPPQL